MKKLVFGSFMMLILAASCKKSTPTPPAAADKFMTFTAGSSWNYSTTDNNASTTTPYTLTATAVDTSINGKTYHIFQYMDATGSSNEYYNNTDNDYYQYTTLSAQLPPMELKYLNDAAAVGNSWSQPISVTQTVPVIGSLTISANIVSSIAEKGSSLTVNGVTYNNVIKVNSLIQGVTSSSSFVTATVSNQNINSYFAPKIGLIKRDFVLKLDATAFGQAQNVADENTSTVLLSTTVQ